jgi:hypothetical protein
LWDTENSKGYIMKYVYLVERATVDRGRYVILGIFTSRKTATEFVGNCPEHYTYGMYKLPVNELLATADERLSDQLGRFDHWHFGR